MKNSTYANTHQLNLPNSWVVPMSLLMLDIHKHPHQTEDCLSNNPSPYSQVLHA